MHDRLPIPEIPDAPKPTVLVVEDEVLIRLDIADELRRAGYLVLEAARAEDALRLLRSGHPVDVVFSDYQLQGALDGWDLRRALAAEFPQLPFILTSAQALRPEWRDSAVPFLPKPYEPKAVLAAIGHATAGGLGAP